MLSDMWLPFKKLADYVWLVYSSKDVFISKEQVLGGRVNFFIDFISVKILNLIFFALPNLLPNT